MKQLKLCVEAEELDTILAEYDLEEILSNHSTHNLRVLFLLWESMMLSVRQSHPQATDEEHRWVVCASIIQTLESSSALSETQIDLLDSMLASVSQNLSVTLTLTLNPVSRSEFRLARMNSLMSG